MPSASSTHAPSECGSLVARSATRKAAALVRDAGYASYDDFLAEVAERTTARFANSLAIDVDC
jgi:hypothetical protein